MSNKKLKSIEMIKNIKKKKCGLNTNNLNHSCSSNVKIKHDSRYYEGEKIINEKILGRV